MRTLAMLLAGLLAVAPSLEARRRAVAPIPIDQTTLSTADWVKRNAKPFLTDAPGSGLDDLHALRQIVGDARIVSLGEATHGTREFFRIKHRILEYLVREMGFTVFAIEAVLPEADRVNDYVLHGIGDPGVALDGMYFWTWDTEEVLEMILWMRQYNLTRGDRPPVYFRGFDMQYSKYAMESIGKYLDRIDPPTAASVRSLWSCWEPHVMGARNYSRLTAQAKSDCAAKLAQVHEAIASRRELYVRQSSAQEYDTILRYARVMVQNEGSAAGRPPGRDASMAENTAWLAEVAHPGEKLVLWAHNGHVGVDPTYQMGYHLRQHYPGTQMVIFAFLFDHGEFTAAGPKWLHSVAPVNDGYDAMFRTAGHRFFFLDLRKIPSTAARQYFGTSNTMWMIGASFDDLQPMQYRRPTTLSRNYDVAIWVEETTASRLR